MDMQLQIPCRRLLLRSASFMMALGAGAALLSPWVASLVLVRCCCWTGGVGPSTIVLADGVLFLLFWLSACWLLLLLASIPS